MIALDMLLAGAQIVDVFRLRTCAGWVGIRDGRILYAEEGDPPAGLGGHAETRSSRPFFAPGLIDAHMHIESSLVTPRGFAEAAMPEIIRDFDAVKGALRALGVRHRQPFLMLSLQSLSVSPYYKFTDKGVLDTERRRLLPTWVAAKPIRPS